MASIHIMPDALASQVAAGEVVERPAAVVRELVENSLDAGATHVEVEVQRGGSALIRITDNGAGMEREDAMLCIERHATSKIRTKEDLASIHTYGFRGEALPSIASVSRFRLVTRQTHALSGTEIEIHGGKLAAVRESGSAAGTMVEARSLFYNVPARRKFLRSESTEYAHVEQQFLLHAIANPKVGFTLIKDASPVFHLPGTDELIERIRGLVGQDMGERLLRVLPVEHQGIEVSGYIGGPGYSRANRQLQLVFLNGRCIESPVLHHALREGYHTTLMKGQYPVTFLFLRMDPEAFDINVHPAKKEVRFHDGFAVRDVLSRVVQDTLNQSRVLPQGHSTPVRPVVAAPVAEPERELALPLPVERSVVQAAATAPIGPMRPMRPMRPMPESAAVPVVEAAPAPEPAPAKPEEFRILGVVGKLYVIMESSEGMVLMDQHAAHERILFEKVRRGMEQDGVPTQRLLMPVMLTVSPRDYELLSRNLPALARLGIEAEPFGANTLKVDALPQFMRTDDPAALLSQVVDELGGLSARSSSLRLGEDMIATVACRAAVKANDVLRGPELEALVKDLMACEMPYCCPHGRPTLIQMSYGELEKKFGRRAP